MYKLWDDFFILYIKKWNFLKEKTKKIYLENVNNIMDKYFINKDIYYVILNPKILYEKIKNTDYGCHNKYFKFSIFYL